MRTTWLGTQVLALGLLALASCKSGPDKYKPEPHPEQYALPPDDPRFSKPIQFPKDTLNKDNPKKDDGDMTPGPTKSPGRTGVGMSGG